MSYYQDVQYVQLFDKISITDFKEAFEFRKDRKYPKLQKLCFWILRKLDAFYISKKITTQRVNISGKTLIEALMTQKRDLIRNFNLSGKTILIGNDEWIELMGNPEINQMLRFRANGYGIMDLDVIVVPWMTGILVMPEM
jgi:hypothetical protein